MRKFLLNWNRFLGGASTFIIQRSANETAKWPPLDWPVSKSLRSIQMALTELELKIGQQ